LEWNAPARRWVIAGRRRATPMDELMAWSRQNRPARLRISRAVRYKGHTAAVGKTRASIPSERSRRQAAGGPRRQRSLDAPDIRTGEAANIRQTGGRRAGGAYPGMIPSHTKGRRGVFSRFSPATSTPQTSLGGENLFTVGHPRGVAAFSALSWLGVRRGGSRLGSRRS
jgi:hypothetical protein